MYILLLENEYYVIHGIFLLAFVTCTGTKFNMQLQELSLASISDPIISSTPLCGP